MRIHCDEKQELLRILNGGDFDRSFWYKKWSEAREPNPEEELRKQLAECKLETVEHRREARKIQKKLRKLAGKKRAFSQLGYAQNWSEEQKRLDNLEHAAVYLSRANTGFHFYA